MTWFGHAILGTFESITRIKNKNKNIKIKNKNKSYSLFLFQKTRVFLVLVHVPVLYSSPVDYRLIYDGASKPTEVHNGGMDVSWGTY